MSTQTVPPFTPASECWTPVRDICTFPTNGGTGSCAFHITSPRCGGGSGHCYPQGSETAARVCPLGWTTADALRSVDKGATQHSITCCPGTYGDWTIDSQTTDLCSLRLQGGSIVVQVNDAPERCDGNEYIETLVWESGSDASLAWVDGSPGTTTTATGPLVVAIQANVIKLSWMNVPEPTTTSNSSTRQTSVQGSTSTPTQLGPTTTPSASSSPGDDTASNSQSGLTQKAQIGLGVGITAVAVVAIGLLLLVWLRRRRPRRGYRPPFVDGHSEVPGQGHHI